MTWSGLRLNSAATDGPAVARVNVQGGSAVKNSSRHSCAHGRSSPLGSLMLPPAGLAAQERTAAGHFVPRRSGVHAFGLERLGPRARACGLVMFDARARQVEYSGSSRTLPRPTQSQ